MRIPLPKMMRHWREREFEKRLTPGAVRTGLGVWAVSRGAAVALPAGGADRQRRRCGRSAGGRGRLASLPLAGGWTGHARLAGAAGADVHGPVEGRAAVSARERILGRLARGGRAAGGGAARRRSRRGSPRIRPGRCRAQAQSHGPRAAGAVHGQKLEAAAATVGRVSAIAELPKALAHELRKRNLPAAVRFGDDPMFDGLDWGTIETSRGVGRHRGAGDAEPGGLRARRDRHAGAGLGAGQPGDADLPRRDAFRGAARGGHLRRLRGLLGRPGAPRGATRARSTSSPARRARPTSARCCSSARTGRWRCTSSSSADEHAEHPRPIKATDCGGRVCIRGGAVPGARRRIDAAFETDPPDQPSPWPHRVPPPAAALPAPERPDQHGQGGALRRGLCSRRRDGCRRRRRAGRDGRCGRRDRTQAAQPIVGENNTSLAAGRQPQTCDGCEDDPRRSRWRRGREARQGAARPRLAAEISPDPASPPWRQDRSRTV